MSDKQPTELKEKTYNELTPENIGEIKAILKQIEDLVIQIPLEYLEKKKPALLDFAYGGGPAPSTAMIRKGFEEANAAIKEAKATPSI